MYASPAQRAEEIERGAAESPAELRREVSESAVQFSAEFGQLTEDERERIVVTAQGRHVPARELVWIRCRELGVHAVDLDAGTTFYDLPAAFIDGLVHEIVDKRLKSGEGANLAALLSGRAEGRPLERWL
jgi:maleylpyruvate isomerase